MPKDVVNNARWNTNTLIPMKPISRDIAWIFAILVPFGAGLALHKYVLGVVNVQALNMEIAQENIARAHAMLQKNDLFKDVAPFIYTGQGGALGLSGSVKKERDLFELMKAVADEQLPVTVHWRVKIAPERAGN
jgi:hypothetical protein